MMTMVVGGQPGDPTCPVCDETRRSYAFVVRGLPVVRCQSCNHLSLSLQPDRLNLPSFYGVDHGDRDPRLVWMDPVTERDAAHRYLGALATRGLKEGSILLIAPLDHPFRREAERRGFVVAHHATAQEWQHDDSAGRPDGRYDVAIVLYQLEQAQSPREILTRVYAALKPGGLLLVALPSLDSRPARWLGKNWTEWRPENIHYFNRLTIQSLLERTGFSEIWSEPERRIYTFRHIHDRGKSLPRTLITRSISLAYRLAPGPLRDRRLRLESSGMIVTAIRGALRTLPLCSIVVPAYNERDTFPVLMEALIEKQLPGMQKEIIIVESNSTDGTRELAQRYVDHPEVTLLLEERPRGKGHAVRQGLAHARGDIVMIQDADLEYDLNDYEDLLQPLMTHAAPFVLGGRHSGSFKMRQFSDQSFLAMPLNVGHVLFTALLNLLYGQRMRDPFTMYKVFRRECLYGLDFECNRFDFDIELLSKLLRKGYDPLEIPVNYRARSFSEGKKVSIFRDPWTWLRAGIKYRFAPLRGPRNTHDAP
jgi:SAM-dependent methyltransferase